MPTQALAVTRSGPREMLADQHQGQGVDATGGGAEDRQGRPQQFALLDQPGQRQADARVTRPQARCRARRSTRSESQPSGTWQNMSPPRITLAISAATPTAPAMPAGIHREQRQHHRIEEGEEQHAQAQRRGDADEAEQEKRGASSAVSDQSAGRLCQTSARATRLAATTSSTGQALAVPNRLIIAGPPSWQPVKQAA